jgi:hypothetical protein
MEKENIILPDIEFEGKIVKAKNGYYKCPYHCSSGSGYPTPKWKTEKGFRQHMKKCTGKPSYFNKRIEENKIKNEKIIELKKKCIDSGKIPYKIGDTINYYGYHVTKPTHVQKFNRMVRVRYEEERSYYAETTTVNHIDFEIPFYHLDNINIDDIIKNYMVINHKIHLHQIFQTLQETIDIKNQEAKRYKEDCDHASMCR